MLSVVIPAHNEGENLPPLIQGIKKTLTDRNICFEVWIVDDASTDTTVDLLKDLCSKYSWLHSVRHKQQSGQSAGLCTGVRSARFSWVVTLDGDGQNDPSDIGILWDHLQTLSPSKAQKTLVMGKREQRQDKRSRILASRLANGLRSWLLNDKTPDTGCSLKLFSKETFLRLPAFDHMHRFLPALFQREGGAVVSLPVTHHPRLNGQSHYSNMKRFLEGIIDLCGVFWLLKRGLTTSLEKEEGNDVEPLSS